MSTVRDCQCENRFPQWDSRSEKSPPVEISPSAAARLSRARTHRGLGAVFKYFLLFIRYFSVHTWSDDQRLEVPLEYEGVVPCPGVDDEVAGGVGEQPGLPRPPEVVSQVRGLGQERAECLLNTIRRSGDLLIMRGQEVRRSPVSWPVWPAARVRPCQDISGTETWGRTRGGRWRRLESDC